jgi:hypothetical protein
MRVFAAGIAFGLMSIAAAQAEEYVVTVTRKAENLYKVDSRNVYVKTRDCREYAYGKRAVIRLDSARSDARGKLSSPTTKTPSAKSRSCSDNRISSACRRKKPSTTPS